MTLTQAQLQKITLFTVRAANYRRTVDTTGMVDFDNDQASPVLAPFSGPVSRLLVQPGDKVKKGDALAAVVSPDFATAVSTYRKALVTAQNARRLADLDKDLLAHQGVSAREEATGPDRCRQRRSRPRRGAAGAAIAQCDAASDQRHASEESPPRGWKA